MHSLFETCHARIELADHADDRVELGVHPLETKVNAFETEVHLGSQNISHVINTAIQACVHVPNSDVVEE